MKITESVLRKIICSFPPAPPEGGGIVGGKNGIINVFCFDNIGSQHQAVYVPDVEFLNGVIEEWYKCGVSFYGIVHSHMGNELSLSEGDVGYIHKVMASMSVGEKLYFPIVSGDCVVPYVATRTATSVHIDRDELDILR